MLTRYDPESAPDPEAWLAGDFEELVRLIRRAHRRLRVELPKERVHAVFHLIVENQVAMGDDTPAAETLQRLMGEGLTRHEAIHAVGSVLAVHMNDLVAGENDPAADPNDAYFRELRELTAESWRRNFS